jgi:hypothetical protein
MSTRIIFAAACVSVIGLVACQGVSGESDTAAQPRLVQEQNGAVQIARCVQEPDEEAPEVGQRLELALNVILKNGHAVEIDGDLKVTDESQSVSSALLGRIASIKSDGGVHVMSLAKAKKGSPSVNISDAGNLSAEKISLHTELSIVTISSADGGMREVTGCVFKNLNVLGQR